MALPATGVIEIRATATANNVNGGGFNSARGGTDYTLQNAAQLTGTDLTCTAGSTTVGSASGGFTSQMVGNYVHLTALTGTGAIVGWYEIVTYTDANNVVLDRTPTNGVNNITAGTYYVGGAMSLNSTLDDDLFEIGVAGNIFYVKNGSYTLGESVNIAAAGGTQNPIKVVGYNSSRGDNPTGSTRPTIACAGSSWTSGANWDVYGIIFTGSSTTVYSLGTNGKAVNCKVVNTSTTAARTALSSTNGDVFIASCEAISYRGRALTVTATASIRYVYAHDSDVGIRDGSGASPVSFVGCISESNVSFALSIASAATGTHTYEMCTFYGAENKTGVAVDVVTGSTDIRMLNTIIYGFTTGVNNPDTQSVGYDDYNCYYNNTNDVSAAGQWQKGANDSTLNPTFTNVAQVTGTAGKFAASNDRIIDTSKNFSTSGVVANQDYIYIVSGTGVTAGIYQITSIATTTNPNDTLVLSPAPGTNTTADKVYQITTGHNFAIGTNLKALGAPGAFPGGLSTGYMDIGAVQRQEPSSSGGMIVHPGMSGGM